MGDVNAQDFLAIKWRFIFPQKHDIISWSSIVNMKHYVKLLDLKLNK